MKSAARGEEMGNQKTDQAPPAQPTLTAEEFMEDAVAWCPDCLETYCHERITDRFRKALEQAQTRAADALRADRAVLMRCAQEVEPGELLYEVNQAIGRNWNALRAAEVAP